MIPLFGLIWWAFKKIERLAEDLRYMREYIKTLEREIDAMYK